MTRNTLRLALLFYKEFQSLNLPISLFFALVTIAEAERIITHLFLVTFVLQITGGFALTAFVFESRFKNRYFFYYNWGLSRLQLYGFTMLINMIGLIVLALIVL